MYIITTQKITPEKLYEKLKNVTAGGMECRYSLEKCKEMAPVINEIHEFKEQKNAVILAHTYVRPEIIYGVGDYVGDSYQLSKNALETNADVIVFAAVRFMGETAKILNPDKEVLLPGKDTGCSLADSVAVADVRKAKEQYPDYTFVCYINTTAAIKAVCDVCVTSANVYKVVENIPSEKIFFVPDRMMGQNLINELKARGINKDIKYYAGACHVHEQFNPKLIVETRKNYPGVTVLCHPECAPEIVAQSDFVGSTSQMLDYMRKTNAQEFLMLTECGLATRLQIEMPEKRFVGMCAICEYMKSNTLKDVLRVLKDPQPKDKVEVDEEIRIKAKKCLEAMFQYTK